MGNCNCCTKPSNQYLELNIPPRWAHAVSSGSYAGVLGLHVDDPSIAEKYVTKGGKTALHVAASKNYPEILIYLLSEAKVDINTKALRTGNTALHEAALTGEQHMIRLLLQYGADPHITNKRNETPRDLTPNLPTLRLFDKHRIAKLRAEGPPPYIPVGRQGGTSSTSSSDIVLGGESLKEKRRKLLESGKRRAVTSDAPRTKFARNCGIELDFVAEYLQNLQAKERLWKKCVKYFDKENVISSKNELYKLLYHIVQEAMKHYASVHAEELKLQKIKQFYQKTQGCRHSGVVRSGTQSSYTGSGGGTALSVNLSQDWDDISVATSFDPSSFSAMRKGSSHGKGMNIPKNEMRYLTQRVFNAMKHFNATDDFQLTKLQYKLNLAQILFDINDVLLRMGTAKSEQ